MKTNFFLDNPDIAFHLSHKVDYQEIFDLLSEEEKNIVSAKTADDYQKTVRELIESVGEVAGGQIAANAHQVEREKLKLDDQGEVELGAAIQANVQTLKEMGACGLSIQPKFGGLGVPFIFEALTGELVSRACPSTLLHLVWYSPIASIIDHYGNEEQRQQFIPKIAQGEYSGCMALTEPEAGSDLANMRTYGEKQPDGNWKIYGSKRFISNGCADICLLLAKTAKSAQGLKSLNLYLVPRHLAGKRNFRITKIEEKIALHGSPTCELQFDGSDAYLLGKEGEGFPYMLRLMNEARVAVGFQGLGQMEATFRLANKYAAERKTWNKPLVQHELINEMLLDMEVEVRAFRSLCYQAGYYITLMYLTERKLKAEGLSKSKRDEWEKKLARYKKQIRKWTPLIKWFVGERSFVHARNGLQIHGGYGFTTEYKAEWWLRESLILAIYEGTSQMQALMCIKDTLKDVIRRPAEFIEVALGTRLRGIAESDPLRKKLLKAKQLVNSAVVSILFKLVKENVKETCSELKPSDIFQVVKILSKDLVKFENISFALLHAERICEMKSYVALANCVVKDAAIDPERKWIAERLLNKMLPQLTRLKEEIETDDPVIAQRLRNIQRTAYM